MTVARPFFQLFALLALGCALAGAEFLSEHLSGMTPYTYAQTGHGLPYTPPEQCRLSGLDAVFRHGSRYPSRRAAQAVRGLEDLLARHQDALRLDWMRTWRNPYTNRTAELLCQNGVDELASLGRDFRAKFSSILSPYNPNSVVFTSTFVCFPPVNTFIVSDGFCFPFFHFVFNLLLFLKPIPPSPFPSTSSSPNPQTENTSKSKCSCIWECDDRGRGRDAAGAERGEPEAGPRAALL